VKTRLPDLMGREVDVLCVKGSGADMAVIEPDGLPAVRLAELRMLRARDTLSDEDMAELSALDETAGTSRALERRWW